MSAIDSAGWVPTLIRVPEFKFDPRSPNPDAKCVASGGAAAAPELDARRLQAEVWQLRQLLADMRTLQGWTAAGRLSGNGNDLSVHRRHPKGVRLRRRHGMIASSIPAVAHPLS